MHFHGPIVRPPTDASSLFIEVTVGCTHNSCTFCNFYEGYPFRVAPWEQIEADVKEAAMHFPKSKKIWASGGNPFALSVEKLTRLAKLFQTYFPDCRIATYARIDDLYQKSVEDLKNLHALGYDNLVIGIESADDEVLAHVNKGYTGADVLRELKKMDASGMTYRVIYLGGIGGRGKCEQDARNTAAVLNQVHPSYLFLTTVAFLPGTPLYDEIQQGIFKAASETERLCEFRTFISALTNPITIDARGAANAVSFLVHLPRDKERILVELDRLIEHMDSDTEKALQYRRSLLKSV